MYIYAHLDYLPNPEHIPIYAFGYLCVFTEHNSQHELNDNLIKVYITISLLPLYLTPQANHHMRLHPKEECYLNILIATQIYQMT